MKAALLLVLALLAGLALGALAYRRKTRQLERERFIRGYVFQASLLQTLAKTYPMVQDKEAFLVARALRTYFLVHLRAAPAPVGMPSKAVDALWHEFILDTKAYHAFCAHAFGGYFHHIPARQMARGASSDAAMRRTWRLACLEENINPQVATRLPLLFAIDAKLGIPDANTYTLGPEPKQGSDGGGCSGFACAGNGPAGGNADGGSDGGGGDGCGGGCGGT